MSDYSKLLVFFRDWFWPFVKDDPNNINQLRSMIRACSKFPLEQLKTRLNEIRNGTSGLTLAGWLRRIRNEDEKPVGRPDAETMLVAGWRTFEALLLIEYAKEALDEALKDMNDQGRLEDERRRVLHDLCQQLAVALKTGGQKAWANIRTELMDGISDEKQRRGMRRSVNDGNVRGRPDARNIGGTGMSK